MSSTIAVTVIFCPAPTQCWQQKLNLAKGATLADAIEQSEVLETEIFKNFEQNNQSSTNPECKKGHFSARLQSLGLSVGIWARAQPLQTQLSDGDRVEIYRALTIDPKDARRARFAQQGARGTGLFAKRRPGSKAGY